MAIDEIVSEVEEWDTSTWCSGAASRCCSLSLSRCAAVAGWSARHDRDRRHAAPVGRVRFDVDQPKICGVGARMRRSTPIGIGGMSESDIGQR